MNKCLAECGLFICGPNENFAPADSILYRLRNVTATVENIGLIISSIMSKKSAEGIGFLVVDVKFGSASFLKSESQANAFAEMLVRLS